MESKSQLLKSSNLTSASSTGSTPLEFNSSALLSSAVLPELTDPLPQNSRLFRASSAAVIPDPGNSLNTARNITLGATESIFRDSISNSDLSDYYRFTLKTSSILNFGLRSQSKEADIELRSSKEEVIEGTEYSDSTGEPISQFLTPGTYYIHVGHISDRFNRPADGKGKTEYDLTVSATAIADNAGNSLSKARNIGTLSSPQAFSDFVGDPDPDDYYSFKLGNDSVVKLLVSGLSQNADVTLLQDRNNNSVVDATEGENLLISNNPGTEVDSIDYSLAAGTYFIGVHQPSTFNGIPVDPFSGTRVAGNNTNYDIGLTALPVPDDRAGNTQSTALNLGTLDGTQTFSDFVGDFDGQDYYLFSVAPLQDTFLLEFDGLSADADVELLFGPGAPNSGVTLTKPERRGTQAEYISFPSYNSLAPGNYYIRVSQHTGNTNYTLKVTSADEDLGSDFLSTAGDLPGFGSDSIGGVDFFDYYRFKVVNDGFDNLHYLNLAGGADVDMQLLVDNNTFKGKVIASGVNTTANPAVESISLKLDPGTYYILVKSGDGVTKTGYTLSRSTIPPASEGNTIATAKKITNPNSAAFKDIVGSGDPSDYYRFDLSRSQYFSLNVIEDTYFKSTLDVHLLDSFGSFLEKASFDGYTASPSSGIFGSYQLSMGLPLEAGTYYIQIFPASSSSNGNYQMKISNTFDAGNTLNTAFDIDGIIINGSFTNSITNFVDKKDTNDYYRFTLDANFSRNYNVSAILDKVTAATNLELLDSSGKKISSFAVSTGKGSTPRTLDAGIYYVRVFPGSSGTKASYSLTVSASPDGLAKAKITPLSIDSKGHGFFNGSGIVRAGNGSNFFGFTVSQSGILNAGISGLTGDADVRLIQDRDNDRVIDQGEVVAWNWERGTRSESIRHFLSPGTYFFQVMSYNNQNTSYSLSSSFARAASDPQDFSIEVRFVDRLRGELIPIPEKNPTSFLNQNALNAIREAAQVWEQVIAYGSFAAPQKLVIDVIGAPLPMTPTLITDAQAGPVSTASAFFSGANNIPIRGEATININRKDIFNTDPTYLKELMVHEFGHVLGIGTLWEPQKFADVVSTKNFIDRATKTYRADTYAGWAYGELLGKFQQTAVPVEEGVFKHWDETTFSDEMMTPLLAPTNVLSQLTIASLKDYGWHVNFGAADLLYHI